MVQNVTNRLSELPRPSREFPRRFVPDNLDFSDWRNIEPFYMDLLDRKLDSREALEQWLFDESELGAVVAEEGTRRRIATTCATDNKDTENAYLHFVEQILPKAQPLGHKINLKLLDCTHLSDLDKKRYEVMIRLRRNRVDLFCEENIPLGVELTKLVQQYQKIMGIMTVDYHSRELTLQQLGVYARDADRDIRKEAWELMSNRRLRDADDLDELFNKMLKLRVQLAKNAGFDDFRDYQFRNYNRFDYTPDDCYTFHDSIEKYVVPLTRRLIEERKDALNLEQVMVWDTACDRYGREPLQPFKDVDQLVSGCERIFGMIDEELGERFKTMIDLGLLDLESRKGKAPGGYQSALTEVRLPFIFMNATGVDGNVFTLLHEGGHAFHQFAVRDEPILSYRHAPMEFNEVASMSMEKLGSAYLEVFYNQRDAARGRRNHFEGTIWTLKSVGLIDSFQHWIYTHPEHTSKERGDEWGRLTERFSSGVDWTGHEEAMRYSWQGAPHIYKTPFYFIEYGIAQLGALQVWQNSLKDKNRAVKTYKAALRLGGSRPLPELFEAAGIKFDFSDAIIEPLMTEVSEEINRQDKLENR